MVKKPRVKGEELRESFVGISALKASLNQNIESLLSGEVDHIVILRNNKAVGVMLSFEDYQQTKYQASLAPQPSISEAKDA